MSALLPLLFLAVALAAMAALVGRDHGKRKAFVAAFDDDPHYVAKLSVLKPLEVTNRQTLPAPFRLEQASKQMLWHGFLDGCDLGHRTTLAISQEGLLQDLRDRVGFADIKVGDASFDVPTSFAACWLAKR